MPLDPLHEQKKRKNYAVLMALLCFALIIFFVSIIRMKERVRDNMQKYPGLQTAVTAPHAAKPPAASSQQRKE